MKNHFQNVCVDYVQKNNFSRKQYEKLKNDMGFIIVDKIIRCTARMQNISLSLGTDHMEVS